MNFSKIILLSTSFLLFAGCAAYTSPYAIQQTAQCDLCHTTQPIVYEDSLAFIIKKELSTLKTSLIIVPKQHIADLDELNLDVRSNQQLLIHLMSLAQMLASRLAGTQSYRITVNAGSALQDAPHLCIHFESSESLQKA